MKSTKGMKWQASRIDPRYLRQQQAIKNACEELGLVPFYPDYHGMAGDKNTVIVYTKEDAVYNEEQDGASRPEYRPFLWNFENSDVNGKESYDFANHGQLDLRGHEEKVLRGAIRTAYFRKMQNEYLAAMGGVLSIPEADDTYNDLNRDIIGAFIDMTDGKAVCGKFTGGELPKKPEPPFWNFSMDFLLPKNDDAFEMLLQAAVLDMDEIHARLKKIGGIYFLWY